ncbi:MAG: tRNA (N6-threonylcarbamoyladenosine(37)-N6)-methyltransferase TrmO [Desulfovibrionaceae bacterium]
MDKELQIIGWVKSDYTDRDQCPKMEDEGGIEAVVAIEPVFADALDGLREGQRLVLFTWLHQAGRNHLKVHPRGNPDNPLRGVFATRSPDRPNPMGMHEVTLVGFESPTRLRVAPLEVLDGTPVIDIKPLRATPMEDAADRSAQRTAQAASPASPEPDNWGESIPSEVGEAIQTTCLRAWTSGLLRGCHGNVSVRLGNSVVITCSGSAKGYLLPGDLTSVDLTTGKRLDKGRPSSETGMHLETYDAQPKAWAIVHTHPPHLLALSLRVPEDKLLDVPLFESEVMRKNFAQAPAHAPGTGVLAKAVSEASKTCQAVFMRNHGLVCWGENLQEALALSEDVEHLARIQLMSLGTGSSIFDSISSALGGGDDK